MSAFERRMSRREMLQAGAVSSLALYLAACGGGGGDDGGGGTSAGGGGPTTLSWMTWADHYLEDPNQLARVRSKTQVGARPQLFSDNSEAYLKLQQSPEQLDVVSGDSLWITKFGAEDLITSFDLAEVPASEQLYPVAKDVDFWKDGSKYWGYPFGWSSILIFYNPKHVSPAPTSWEVLTDPKYKGRITMENQPTELMAFSGSATGAKEPYDMTPDEIDRAKEFLRTVKPNILKLVAQNTEAVAALTNEEAWISTGNLGYDVRVQEAGGPEIKSIIPKEGTVGWADCEALVAVSDKHESALEWLDAMEQAEYIAQNFVANGRPLFNEKAYKLLVDQGEQERADRFLYNKPEQAFEMTLKGPAADTQTYIDAVNEIFGA
jgi:spermidine/putrescine-binding protein